MRKVMSILAVIVFSMGMYSCDADSSVEDDALYDTIACDTCSNPTDERDGTEE